MKSHSGLTIGTPRVRTHTLDLTPDAPRSYNPTLPIRLLDIDALMEAVVIALMTMCKLVDIYIS